MRQSKREQEQETIVGVAMMYTLDCFCCIPRSFVRLLVRSFALEDD